MIHTIQMHCFLNLDTIRQIEDTYTKSIDEVLQEIGNNNNVVINIKRDVIHNMYVLYLFVDAIKALKKADIIEEDVSKMKKLIENIEMQLLLEGESGFVLNRIDYRRDVIIQDEKCRLFMFHLYNKLAKKYAHLKKCNRKKKENEDVTEEVYATTLYFNSKSVQIIVYDKETERNQNGEQVEEYEKNILRFEVRLCNAHLKYNQYKKDMRRCIDTYFKQDVSNQYINIYLRRVFGWGDYYNIREVRKILKKATITIKDKEEIEAFLIEVSKRGMEDVIGYRPEKKLSSKKVYSRYQINKYLKILKELNINHILIPVNAQMPAYIKNPLDT